MVLGRKGSEGEHSSDIQSLCVEEWSVCQMLVDHYVNMGTPPQTSAGLILLLEEIHIAHPGK